MEALRTCRYWHMISSAIIAILLLFPAAYLAAVATAVLYRRPMPVLAKVDDHLPSVTVIIASAGESAEILREKVSDTLRLEYPRERLDIILFSDGYALPLPDAITRHADRVMFMQFDRLGKTECQNRCVESARGEIVFFTDLTSRLAKDSLRKTVRWYADPRVGAVGGHFEYRFQGRNLEEDYLRKELRGKERQMRYGFVIGYYGPVYSVRRSVYRPMPAYYPGDLFLPIMTYLHDLYSIIDREIRSSRSLHRTMEKELPRKRRMIAQGIAATLHFLWKNRGKAGEKMDLFAALIFRKLLRWFVIPYGLLVYFSLYFFGYRLFDATVVLLALIGSSFILYRSGVKNAAILAPYYGLLLLLANLLAILDVLRRRSHSSWNPGAL